MPITITPKNIEDEQERMDTDFRECVKLKELAIQLSYPGRSDVMDWYGSIADDRVKTKRGRKIYDPTAIRGLEIWSNGIIGNYMPREINWFQEEMSERELRDIKSVRKWLQETDEHMRFVLNQSNYYEQKLVTIKDAGAIGDSYLFIEEDDDTGKQMMLAPHPREFRIRRDFWGRIVAIHHRFTKTIAQVKGEFGDDALSPTQKLSLTTNPNQNITIIHAIYKNIEFDPDQVGVKNMKWQHRYLNLEFKKIILETGTPTINPIPWNLNRPTHEQYGRGIVSQMFLEILTANLMGKDTLLASQQAARPAMLIPAALKHKIRTGAGGKTFVGNKEMMGAKMGDLVARMIDTGGYPFGENNHEKWQAMIDDRFGLSLFLALNQANSQAYKNIEHIRASQAERAILMSPFLGTLGTTTDMEFDRIYSIELEADRAPEPPLEVLQSTSGRIDIQYNGPLTQLLKQHYETGNLLITIANMQSAMAVAPDSAIVVDGDELMRKILKSGNAPEDIILTREEVTEIKAILAQQQEAEANAELAAKTASMVPDLSKKIEEDSVLSELVA